MSEVQQSGGRGNRVLSPKLQLLWRREQRSENQSATPEEKKNQRKKLRQELQAMGEAEKTALRDRLQAQWDALPAVKKQRIMEKLKKARAGAGRAKNKAQRGDNAARLAKRKARKAAAGKD